jgi:prefoldin alpha subunit
MQKEKGKQKVQNLQEKYIELQMLDQQMKQVQQQLRIIISQIAELDSVVIALDDLKKVKTGAEVLFPITNGIFVKGTLKENKEVSINVGSNIVVNKPIDQAKELIKRQLEEIRNLESQVRIDLQRLAVKAVELEKEVVELSE